MPKDTTSPLAEGTGFESLTFRLSDDLLPSELLCPDASCYFPVTIFLSNYVEDHTKARTRFFF